MLPNLLVRTALVTATVASLGVFGAAPAAAETVEGTITHVELHETPRHIMVRTGGEEVQVRISNRTQVDFGATDQGYFSEELSSLQAGMQVRASFDADQPARLVSVLSVPPEARRSAIDRFERERAGTHGERALEEVAGDGEMRVRLSRVDRRRGTFRADFKGSEREFQTDDPKLLASHVPGDLVILKVRNGEIVDIRSAALRGRVVDIDRTAGRVVVLVDGRERTFRMDRVDTIAKRLFEGDEIRFEVEERAEGDVITDVEKVRGFGRKAD